MKGFNNNNNVSKKTKVSFKKEIEELYEAEFAPQLFLCQVCNSPLGLLQKMEPEWFHNEEDSDYIEDDDPTSETEEVGSNLTQSQRINYHEMSFGGK